MTREDFIFNGSGDVRLHGVKWIPDGKVRAILQITHGMTEHIGRYEALAEVLTKVDIAVCGFDLRGHGWNESELNIATLGKDGWERSITDMRIVRSKMMYQYLDVPYFMLGFSLGSFLLREYLARHSKGIAGAIIAGTGHQPGGLLEIIKMIVMTQIWKNGFDNTTPLVRKLSFETYNKKFAPNKTDFDWLCSDEEQLSDYLNDDGCRRAISSGLFWQLLASMKRTGDKHALYSWDKNMPVMLMSGTDDPVGDNTKGVREVFKAMEKRGFADVKIALYPKARHDIFHEVDSGIADRVAYEIRRWMEERI